MLEHLLFVKSDSSTLSNPISRHDPSFRVPVLISATRCIIQYVILPFVLPFVGIIGETPTWLGLSLNAAAFVSLISSLRRVWQTRHPRRFTYLPLAILMLFVIVVFTVSDLRALRG
jgi:hypothetical protein